MEQGLEPEGDPARLIVTSATYRQSSRRDAPALLERDPVQPAARPRRRASGVEAEMVRDLALAASGPAAARRSAARASSPTSPTGSGTVPYSERQVGRRAPGEDRYRRSLYTFCAAHARPTRCSRPSTRPSREFCTVRRVRTNTPLQALTTLNDPVFVEAARALAAARWLREGGAATPERIALRRSASARRAGPRSRDARRRSSPSTAARRRASRRDAAAARPSRACPSRRPRSRTARDAGRGGGLDHGGERPAEPRRDADARSEDVSDAHDTTRARLQAITRRHFFRAGGLRHRRAWRC